MSMRHQLLRPSLFRLPASMLGAALISFSLFLMMSHMIANDADASTQPPPPSIVFGEANYPEETIPQTPTQHEPPELIQPPTRPTNSGGTGDPDPSIVTPPSNIDVSGFGTYGTPPAVAGGNNVMNSRPDYTPWPVYPSNARRSGIEGYVVLSLTLDSMGRVIKAEVVESHPARVFDQAALSAVQRWSLPSASDGSSRVIQRRIDFNID